MISFGLEGLLGLAEGREEVCVKEQDGTSGRTPVGVYELFFKLLFELKLLEEVRGSFHFRCLTAVGYEVMLPLEIGLKLRQSFGLLFVEV